MRKRRLFVQQPESSSPGCKRCAGVQHTMPYDTHTCCTTKPQDYSTTTRGTLAPCLENGEPNQSKDVRHCCSTSQWMTFHPQNSITHINNRTPSATMYNSEFCHTTRWHTAQPVVNVALWCITLHHASTQMLHV